MYIPYLNKFILFEHQLVHKLQILRRSNIIPIIDYAIENNYKNTQISVFIEKYNQLTNLHSNNFHAIKPSCLNYNQKHLSDLSNHAILKNNCKLLVDAESNESFNTNTQLTNQLTDALNQNNCNVFKTYQMYRKDTMDHLINDMKRCSNQNIWCGIKLVRGAYLTQDKPTNVLLENKKQVDENFDKAMLHILKLMKQPNAKIKLILATHNSPSVTKCINNMCHPNHKEHIYFATLLGMRDDITSYTIRRKFHTMKYVPFGPFHKTLPYLGRRLYENNDIIKHIYP